jgi:hypothetical protein
MDRRGATPRRPSPAPDARGSRPSGSIASDERPVLQAEKSTPPIYLGQPNCAAGARDNAERSSPALRATGTGCPGCRVPQTTSTPRRCPSGHAGALRPETSETDCNVRSRPAAALRATRRPIKSRLCSDEVRGEHFCWEPQRCCRVSHRARARTGTIAAHGSLLAAGRPRTDHA